MAFCLSIICESGFSQNQTITIVSIGDSITTGFNSGKPFSQKQNSWATGSSSRVKSIAKRLGESLERRVESHNFARAGAKAYQLPKQLEKLEGISPDYITLLIGANDVCDFSESHEEQLTGFEDNVDKTLAHLTTSYPKAKILLVPIPDMYNLWEVGIENRCQWKWSLHGFCRKLLNRDRTQLEREQFAERLHDANVTLASLADRYKEHVAFDLELASAEFTFDQVSNIDCFHPSKKGQAYLAETSWQAAYEQLLAD
jgi:lysophospholipase L1-like esterase